MTSREPPPGLGRQAPPAAEPPAPPGPAPGAPASPPLGETRSPRPEALPGLPRLLVLTDRGQAEAAGRTLTETVAAAVRGGARAVVLREKDLPAPDRLDLARELRARLDPVGGLLIVASDAAVARDAGAHGVHLARAEPPPPGTDLLVGRSCHDAAELRAAADLGLDYVTLSPIYPTPSKPGYGPALGPAMAGLLRDTPRCPPVYALGGITPERAAECRTAGAYGIAVMGAVMRAADPAAATAAFARSHR